MIAGWSRSAAWEKIIQRRSSRVLSLSVPTRRKKAVAYFAHDANFFKMLLQLMLLGLPTEGVEVTEENIERWKKAHEL